MSQCEDSISFALRDDYTYRCVKDEGHKGKHKAKPVHGTYGNLRITWDASYCPATLRLRAGAANAMCQRGPNHSGEHFTRIDDQPIWWE